MSENGSDRTYRGPVRALILDWAGTAVDFGSRAPASVFTEVFRRMGVEVEIGEARAPMGMKKRDHIAAMGALPSVDEKWRAVHGRACGAADVDKMYEVFLPLQIETVADHTDLIPGLLPTIEACRALGMKIGSSTGYTREIMDVVQPAAAAQGYVVDAVVTGSEVEVGRPAPWMIFENARRLNVYPMSAIIKIDDTLTGIEAGVHAGCWTVGVTLSGNLMGLSQAEVEALSPDERQRRVVDARFQMQAAGAHYILDSVADLMTVVEDIERRLVLGDKP